MRGASASTACRVRPLLASMTIAAYFEEAEVGTGAEDGRITSDVEQAARPAAMSTTTAERRNRQSRSVAFVPPRCLMLPANDPTNAIDDMEAAHPALVFPGPHLEHGRLFSSLFDRNSIATAALGIPENFHPGGEGSKRRGRR